MRSYVGVGLLVLLFVFPVAFFGSLGVTFFGSPSFGALKAYPNLHLEYIRNAFLFQIQPSAAALAVSIIAFVKEIKHPTGIFDKFWLHLAAFGAFFFLWGVLGNVWTWGNYFEAKEYWINYVMPYTYGFEGVEEHVIEVYEVVSAGHILWMIAGVLYISPLFNRIFNWILGER